MKKIYLFALCSAVCLSAAADGLRFKSAGFHKRAKRIARTEAAVPVWRPVSQTDYMHDGEDWMEMGKVDFTYDMRGNCVSELADVDGFLYKTDRTFDDNNLPLTVVETESEDGDVWENVSKLSYIYDTKIHDFVTERLGYDWTDGEWVKNYRCETNSITRNGAGSIVELVKSLPMGGVMQPAYKSVWKYASDGKANEYMYYQSYDGIDWMLYDGLSYKDIVWEKTDGQMTVYGDLRELTEGENLLKSAVVCLDGEPDGHYLVEYADDGIGFLIKETTNDIDQIGITTQLEVLDANGSMRYTVTEYFDEDGNILTEPTYISVEQLICDEHGNPLEYSGKETIDGFEEMMASTKYVYLYDDNGNVKEMTSSEYDYEADAYFPMEKIVYGEYVNAATSGIKGMHGSDALVWKHAGEAISVAGAGVKGLSVYTTQGICVKRVAADDSSADVSLSGLQSGVYIIRAEGTGSVYRVVKR